MLDGSEAATNNDQRAVPRRTAIASGQVYIADTVFDCLILDISTNGARIRFSGPLAIPEFFTLRVRGGVAYPARRRWTRGVEIGVEFTGAAVLQTNERQIQRASTALGAFRTGDLVTCMQVLRAEGFFGDEELRISAEQAEKIVKILEEKLRHHARKRACQESCVRGHTEAR